MFRAMRLIGEARAAEIRRCSSLYETEPVGGVSGGNFINAIFEVHSLLGPIDLLKRLKVIERSMGRSGGRNEAREIDVDIIAFGRMIMQSAELTLPHPRYAERAFVLLPLSEIAPDFRCPLTGSTISELMQALPPGQSVSLASTRRMLCI